MTRGCQWSENVESFCLRLVGFIVFLVCGAVCRVRLSSFHQTLKVLVSQRHESSQCRRPNKFRRPGARRSLFRERSRQPEPAEHAAFKPGHGANPIAGEREDEE